MTELGYTRKMGRGKWRKGGGLGPAVEKEKGPEWATD
jgi:hypothetical protein